MFIRATLLVLVALNLGAALWWLAQPEAPVAALQRAQDPAVPSLTLLTEAPSLRAAATVPETEPDPPVTGTDPANAPPEPEPPATIATDTDTRPPEVVSSVPERCYRLGPFTSETAARAVRSELGAIVKRPQIREIAAPIQDAENRYRIIHPPLPSQEQAEAVARRINEAGFHDYFLITTGPQANAIALGIFRNREGAERQLKALQNAGFPVQLIPENEGRMGPSQWWLDAQIGDIAAARSTARIGARQVQALSCDTLR